LSQEEEIKEKKKKATTLSTLGRSASRPSRAPAFLSLSARRARPNAPPSTTLSLFSPWPVGPTHRPRPLPRNHSLCRGRFHVTRSTRITTAHNPRPPSHAPRLGFKVNIPDPSPPLHICTHPTPFPHPTRSSTATVAKVVPPSPLSSCRSLCYDELRLGASRSGLASNSPFSLWFALPSLTLFPVQSWICRHCSKPPPCRCRLRGDPESRFEVRNLPSPLHFPPLLSVVRNCSSEFPAPLPSYPTVDLHPPVPLPRFSPHHWVPCTRPHLPRPPQSP
jgi:hypothetical protein